MEKAFNMEACWDSNNIPRLPNLLVPNVQVAPPVSRVLPAGARAQAESDIFRRGAHWADFNQDTCINPAPGIWTIVGFGAHGGPPKPRGGTGSATGIRYPRPALEANSKARPCAICGFSCLVFGDRGCYIGGFLAQVLFLQRLKFHLGCQRLVGVGRTV
jgi:hypothetical protein